MTSSSLEDVSELLFSSNPPVTMTEPLVGPIQISSGNANVVHGRGLVATRDVAVGECLFVIPPTVAASWKDVVRIYNGKKRLEEIAEIILLKHMKRNCKTKRQAASFMYSTTGSEDAILPVSTNDLEICLGQAEPEQAWWEEPIKDETLLQIIRHNAFGPEFHNYTQMEQKPAECYARVLGMYPLAAVINHSCQPNAVRVFSGELMVVHACQPIAIGTEIVWSYIPPTQSFTTRQEQLQGKFDFTCTCPRCTVEGSDLANVRPHLVSLNDLNIPNMRMARTNLEPHMQQLERILKEQSNEICHYLRTCYLNVYLNYMNASDVKVHQKEIMNIAMQLHLALSVCHYASTEHLSILHLCYELSNGGTFWTEQLKRAHMARYGSMGNNLERIRQAMQHTKGILRSLDGMQRRRYAFL